MYFNLENLLHQCSLSFFLLQTEKFHENIFSENLNFISKMFEFLVKLCKNTQKFSGNTFYKKKNFTKKEKFCKKKKYAIFTRYRILRKSCQKPQNFSENRSIL